MSFDLVGVKCKNRKGEYFRANIWWWPPLWNYVCEHCKDILAPKQIEDGHYNSFVFIEEEQARIMADRLETLMLEGKIKQHEKEYVFDTLRNSNKGSYKTAIDIAKALNYPARAFKFNAEVVKEFIEFAKNSGGFVIG
ncbi:MAG: hypothetical protein HQ575_07140 [Candidatus Omnitrophica bacterium]|nr:hypothetical protein [Candidatus Omnitrophota bacterium]